MSVEKFNEVEAVIIWQPKPNLQPQYAGNKMGPAKLKKAESLGVAIISEQEFVSMIKDNGSNQ